MWHWEKRKLTYIFLSFLFLAFDRLLEVYETNQMSNTNFCWRHVQLSKAWTNDICFLSVFVEPIKQNLLSLFYTIEVPKNRTPLTKSWEFKKLVVVLNLLILDIVFTFYKFILQEREYGTMVIFASLNTVFVVDCRKRGKKRNS
jgi:hypothetical protein